MQRRTALFLDHRTRLIKKFDDIFSRLDTIHQRDRQTDRQTPGDSKYRAYAQRRAVKMANSISDYNEKGLVYSLYDAYFR